MRKQNQSIIKKMAHKNISINHSRNVFVVIAIFITTFMIATIISLCVSQIEQQYFLNLKQEASNSQIEPIIYILLILAVIIMFAGYLTINNVMSVSVSKDIRLYGLLKTVGMTEKQIKQMIFKQISNLCAIGIPLGLIFGFFTSMALVPLFLKMYTQFLYKSNTISFHPMIFIGTALFAFLVTVSGAYRPARMAARLSPIEAAKFAEYGYFQKKISTTKYSSMKMAWRNVFRVPQRAILVFCNLFLGMTAFLAVSVILGSTNIEMYTKQSTFKNDDSIYLRNGFSSVGNSILNEKKDIFSDKFIDELDKLPGLTKMRVSDFQEIRMDTEDSEGNIQNLTGYVYGLDDEGFSQLNKELMTPIDKEAFQQGEVAIVRSLSRNALVDSENTSFWVDDKMVSYTIGGLMPSEYDDYFGKSYNWFPCVYISDEELKKIVDNPAVYEIELMIEKNHQKEALSMVKNLIADHQNIILYSGIEIHLEAKTIIFSLTIIGNTIAVILWIIGILNFISVVVTEVFARQHEFALLESIGQSVKQSKRELTCEGIIYALITFMLVITLGSTLIYVLFYWMKQKYEYIEFTFPYISLSIMAVVIYSVCLVLPRLVYKYMSRASIIERLKVLD